MSISDPIVIIECDNCRCTDELYLTVTARGWDDRDVEKQFEHLGYVADEKEKYLHLCSDCAAREKEESR